VNLKNRDDQAILEKLDRLGALISARDPAVVDELWSGAGFRLIGSEEGESAATREDLATLMAGLFAKPCRISWAWKDRTVTRSGDLAWVCTECDLVLAYPDRIERRPYRMVCIFQKIDDRWQWRLYSGSEPVK
jgi:SnoaL-like protein